MEARRLHVPSTLSVRPASDLATARSYWLAGEPERCLGVLDQLEAQAGCASSATLLLRARALGRLGGYSEALATLRAGEAGFTTVDDLCTARMLLGILLVRTGERGRGLSILNDASVSARALSSNRTVQAEIAYEQAVAHWMCRELPRAIQFARTAESARVDIVSARAIHLRGFAAVSQRDYPGALRTFHEALRACYAGQERDEQVAASVILQISQLELMLRSSAVKPSLREQRGWDSFDFVKSSVLGAIGTGIMTTEAWHCAHDGNRAGAFRFGRRAAELAPNDYWYVWATSQRGAFAKAFGNMDAAREYAAEAAERARVLDWDCAVGDETLALLFLAEVLADLDPTSATEMFSRYEHLAHTYDSSQVFYDDPRLVAYISHIRGVIRRVNGDLCHAREDLQKAYDIFSELGALWRATLTLIELDEIRVPNEPHSDLYLEKAALIIREHFPRSFLARRLGRWLRSYDDAIVAKLSPSKREVLRYLLEGCAPKDIARLKCLAEGTVRNHICEIEAAFEVHSIQELMAACYRRGLGVASWSDDFDPTATFVPPTVSPAVKALPASRRA